MGTEGTTRDRSDAVMILVLSSLLATIGVVYAFSARDATGSVLLLAASAACAVAARDGGSTRSRSPAPRSPGPPGAPTLDGIWPLVTASGAVVTLVGLTIESSVAAIGVALTSYALGRWMRT